MNWAGPLLWFLIFVGSIAGGKLDWLEEVEGEKALKWVKNHNFLSETRLKADPRFATNLSELKAILTAGDRIPFARMIGQNLYNFWQDENHVRGLWRRTSPGDYRNTSPAWEIVLDIDRLAVAENENWVLKETTCLPGGEKHCLVTLSRGGQDASVVREFDLEKKDFVRSGFDLKEAKSDFTWWTKDILLVATDWGPGTMTQSGYPRQVRVWRRGSDVNQVEPLFTVREEDVGATPFAFHSPEGKQLFVSRIIDFYHFEVFWVGPDLKELRQLPIPLDARTMTLHRDQFVFMLKSRWVTETAGGQIDLPEGAVVSFSFPEWLKTGRLPQVHVLFSASSQEAFESVATTRDALYISYLQNVMGKVRRLEWKNGDWDSQEIPLKEPRSISFVSSSPFHREIFIQSEGFLEPTELLFSSNGLAPFQSIKKLPSRYDSTAMRVKQNWVASADGTQIPYFEISADDERVQARPTILYGYGGFESSLKPWYLEGPGKLWLARGGRFVVANIRGGGEFGPSWHKAGILENRPKVYEDFIAVAEDLLRRGLATKQQLGIMGGSNGGLLVGVAATQRPDLFNAVVCQVPLLDMLRYHKLLAGASWIGEYGSPDDPKMRPVLLSYSPLHNLRAGVKYPEIFFVTSTKDDRVHPAHARKMAFTMEEMGQPFLYYENIEGGHGAAANLEQRAYRSALEYVYLAQKLELP